MRSIDKLSNKIVNAFVKNKTIAPLPLKFTKKISNAQKFRKLCESKVNIPIIGFKAAGTGIPLIKKLKEIIPTRFTKRIVKILFISKIAI
mgnify:CR=1 FL=1